MRSEWRFLPWLLALAMAPPAVAAQAPEEPLLAGSDGVPVPMRVKHVQPVYPPEAAARGLRGIVILSLVVDREGRVEDVEVVRSVPPFDEAAIAAVEQWVYEPTEVEGRPVRVRITVPISFLMKLPEVARQDGIPELRSGAIPPFPPETRQVEAVSAELSLAPDGQVASAQVLEGNSPWSEALIAAVRTWRFDDNDLGPGVRVSFRVEAQFLPEGAGGDGEQRVALQLTGLRRSETPAVATGVEGSPPATAPGAPAEERDESGPAAPEPPAPVEERDDDAPPVRTADAEVPSEPAPSEPVPSEPVPSEPVPSEPVPSEPVPSEPAPSEAAPSEAPPADDGEPESTPAVDEAATAGDEGGADPAAPEPPAGDEEPEPSSGEPAEGAEEEEAGPRSAGAQTGVAEPAGPDAATEVLGGSADPAAAAEPPMPEEPGVSAVRGVFLEPGVPDLSEGRRPTVPPFARMQKVEGQVTVRFAVDAAGQTFVSAVEGPEELRPAARATVESWLFARQSARRLYLLAELSYDDSVATATVKRER